ncbi:MAG: ribosome biogenesis GTP-binding protein YihA/YsxC [Candidatus Tectomicrobia bacterium]|nr:ribosome biogenesis GTP-binding protein YihA/YsxC [Candidatus Tectomicrobia bacterium]
MKISSADFLRSAVTASQYPRQLLPEVAFAGRSNVGKSSLINTLLNRRGLAKTSGTPGKTQVINFFEINHRFMLVDLPGYGYAKVPRQVQAGWRSMVETYLRERELLRAVVHIVDVRHPPTEQDEQLRQWLLFEGVEVVTVATKADKLKRSQRTSHIREVRQTLAMPPEESLLLFSSQNREGRHQLWARLELLLTPVQRHRDGSLS